MDQRKKHHLVIGGGGYPGSKLALALAENGFQVTAFDARAPATKLPDSIKFIKVRTENF